MRLSTRLQVALLLWIVLEIVAFFWVVRLIGGAGALLFTLLGSLFGWTLMKRAGASAITKLRAVVGGGIGIPHRGQFLDETLATVGALGLLVPGFLSDLVGLGLAVPQVRRAIARALGQSAPRAGADRPSVIDLDPGEWRRRDEMNAPLVERDKT